MLVIGGTLVTPPRDAAHVTDDGRHTLQKRVDIENADPFRGVRHETPLRQSHVDQQTMRMLDQWGARSTRSCSTAK